MLGEKSGEIMRGVEQLKIRAVLDYGNGIFFQPYTHAFINNIYCKKIGGGSIILNEGEGSKDNESQSYIALRAAFS